MIRRNETSRVLICDDEPALRDLMRIALIGDYVFEEAATVAEAIEAADRFRPDLILVDVMMPTGSGLDVVAHARNQRDLPRARTIVISAFTDEPDRRRAHEAGADAFMPKPFDPDELSALVRDLLSTPG
ncbi:MAG TPA: response regulator [Gaiellaceae bacterium]|nr:response regulator [Gaiellaceae bacterium]